MNYEGFKEYRDIYYEIVKLQQDAQHKADTESGSKIEQWHRKGVADGLTDAVVVLYQALKRMELDS